MEETQDRIVIVAVDDMFFASKIKAAAAHLNIIVRFTKNVASAHDAAHSRNVSLFIADLQSQTLDVYSMAEELKTFSEFANTRFLGFYSHVNTEVPKRALASGFDKAIPRSAFSRNLEEILIGKSYGDK
jgi:DNA-binding NarL/FixJ family response regulator